MVEAFKGFWRAVQKVRKKIDRFFSILACKVGIHNPVKFGEDVGKHRFIPVHTMKCAHCQKTGFYIAQVNEEAWIKNDPSELPEHIQDLINDDWMEGYHFAKESR